MISVEEIELDSNITGVVVVSTNQRQVQQDSQTTVSSPTGHCPRTAAINDGGGSSDNPPPLADTPHPHSAQPAEAQNDVNTFFDKVVGMTLTWIQLFSRYLGFPLGLQGGKVVVSKPSIWWRVLFFLYTLRTVYIPCVLLIAVVNHWPLLDELQGVWHVTWMVIQFVLWRMARLLLELHVDDVALLWNSLIHIKPVIRKVKLSHVFLFILPPAVAVSGVASCLFAALIPSLMTQFRFMVFYAGQNGYIENELLYAALTCVAMAADCLVLSVGTGIATCAVGTHILFFEVWNESAAWLLEGIEQTSSSAAVDLTRVAHDFRKLSIILRIFNVSNSEAVLLVKAASLLLSIGGISALFILSFEKPLVVMIVGYLGILCTMTYPALYANGYSVSVHLEDFKAVARWQPKWCAQDPAFQRELLAISAKGAWVGSLRTFERESIPVFLDFVFQQVVSIVLSAKEV